MDNNLVKTKRNYITFVIHPTPYDDYDILAIGDLPKLIKISYKEKWYHLIKKSKFGGIPVLIMDTCDTLQDALSCIKQYNR